MGSGCHDNRAHPNPIKRTLLPLHHIHRTWGCLSDKQLHNTLTTQIRAATNSDKTNQIPFTWKFLILLGSLVQEPDQPTGRKPSTWPTDRLTSPIILIKGNINNLTYVNTLYTMRWFMHSCMHLKKTVFASYHWPFKYDSVLWLIVMLLSAGAILYDDNVKHWHTEAKLTFLRPSVLLQLITEACLYRSPSATGLPLRVKRSGHHQSLPPPHGHCQAPRERRRSRATQTSSPQPPEASSSHITPPRGQGLRNAQDWAHVTLTARPGSPPKLKRLTFALLERNKQRTFPLLQTHLCNGGACQDSEEHSVLCS